MKKTLVAIAILILLGGMFGKTLVSASAKPNIYNVTEVRFLHDGQENESIVLGFALQDNTRKTLAQFIPQRLDPSTSQVLWTGDVEASRILIYYGDIGGPGCQLEVIGKSNKLKVDLPGCELPGPLEVWTMAMYLGK